MLLVLIIPHIYYLSISPCWLIWNCGSKHTLVFSYTKWTFNLGKLRLGTKFDFKVIFSNIFLKLLMSHLFLFLSPKSNQTFSKSGLHVPNHIFLILNQNQTSFSLWNLYSSWFCVWVMVYVGWFLLGCVSWFLRFTLCLSWNCVLYLVTYDHLRMYLDMFLCVIALLSCWFLLCMPSAWWNAQESIFHMFEVQWTSKLIG